MQTSSVNGWLRDILFPFFCSSQILAMIIGTALVYIIFLNLDSAFAPIGAASGWIGGTIASYAVAPVYSFVNSQQKAIIVKNLEISGFEMKSNDQWYPPIPKLLFCETAVVRFEKCDDGWKVSGLAPFLNRLLKAV